MIRYDPHVWWSHFFDVRGSMLREILGRVTAFAAWALAVVLLQKHFGDSCELPVTVHTIVGGALGLLLVFRTNSAYDRFWEGRKLWGGIVNESRNLARLSASLMNGNPELRTKMLHWLVALVYASMHGLRGRKEIGPAREWLSAAEGQAAESADHVALYCATQVTNCLRDAREQGLLNAYDLVHLDGNVQLLIDYLGGCERIHRTPLPFAYLVHLRRALMLYCAALPFALAKDFGWIAVPTTLVVTYIFFGIEEIGVEIEDPFGDDDNDLPLEDICGTIERNVLAPLG